MKRELDFKLEQLNERRAELKSDLEMMKSERAEVQRQKTQLKRDEESLKSKYSDFLSDTAEGRTALEAAKHIESQLDEKRQRIDMAIENLKSERLLLRHERQVCELENKPARLFNELYSYEVRYHFVSNFILGRSKYSIQ